MIYSGLVSDSRKISSFSIASRMNSARRFFPAIASMRSGKSSGSRTSTGFTFIGGRPIRTGIFDIGKVVNFISINIKRYRLLTVYPISVITSITNGLSEEKLKMSYKVTITSKTGEVDSTEYSDRDRAIIHASRCMDESDVRSAEVNIKGKIAFYREKP